MKTAIFTGSFDPMTKGHLDLIRRSSLIFNKVIVAVGDNPKKTYLFSKEERVSFIKNSIFDLKNVDVIEVPYGKMSADLAYEHDAVIIKGVRINSDFDYEKMMHEINHLHINNVDTMIFPCQSNMNHISSTAAKEICKLNGNTEDFVTLDVKKRLEEKLNNQKRIVLTGTIGAGKSTIADLISNDHVHNIDLDKIAHNILFYKDMPLYNRIREELSEKFCISEWNRKTVGEKVFSDPLCRKLLNDTIRQPMLTGIRSELFGKVGTIVFNGALIAESDWLHLGNNNVILLTVDKEDQLKRLIDRGYTNEQIDRRLSAQMDSEQKSKFIKNKIESDRFGNLLEINTSNFTVEQIHEKIHYFIEGI